MLIDRTFSELLPGDRVVSDPSERRAAPRIPFETDVTLGASGRVLSGVSSDVGMGGIFVATYATLAVGTRASLRFRLPTGQIVAVGVVRWAREARPGQLGGVGIELTELEEIDRDNLKRFCGDRPRFLSYEEIVASVH
jgi:uncharacterized protein (TIGR02266 family)